MVILLAGGLVLFLAYANGANDNFKGVATLYGSRTTNFSNALSWGSAATLLGSLAAVVFASSLLAQFSGKGIVSEEAFHSAQFPLVIAGASALTVMLATEFGFPISTTHALTGALMGCAFASHSPEPYLAKLGGKFFAPLLVSPLVSIALAYALYPLFRKLRSWTGVTEQTCLCVGAEKIPVTVSANRTQVSYFSEPGMPVTVSLNETSVCVQRYNGQVMGVTASALLDTLHFLSAGLVSFSRGLNDTPKIAALLLISAQLPKGYGIALVGIFILIGGFLNSKKVADTMSNKITVMNPGQAFTANLITGVLVLGASRFGLPVSTTHVSCGTLFGIGLVTEKANTKTILSILVAWVTTLPAAFGISFVLWKLSALFLV